MYNLHLVLKTKKKIESKAIAVDSLRTLVDVWGGKQINKNSGKE